MGGWDRWSFLYHTLSISSSASCQWAECHGVWLAPMLIWLSHLRFGRHPWVHKLFLDMWSVHNPSRQCFYESSSSLKPNLLLCCLAKLHTCFCMYSWESPKSELWCHSLPGHSTQQQHMSDAIWPPPADPAASSSLVLTAPTLHPRQETETDLCGSVQRRNVVNFYLL